MFEDPLVLADVEEVESLALEAGGVEEEELLFPWGTFLKRLWIVVQATQMLFYFFIGMHNYHKIQTGFWSHQKSLFTFQLAMIAYLVIFEYTKSYTQGLYVILLGTSFSMFWTFAIVMDSCRTPEDLKSWKGKYLITKLFRYGMIIGNAALLCQVFWMNGCATTVYPRAYLFLMLTILAHQIYDLVLYRWDYMITENDFPPKSYDSLKYNMELFHKQTKCLFWSSIVFGSLSLFTVIMGFEVINNQRNGVQEHLVCVDGEHWKFTSTLGAGFVTCH